MLLKPFEIEVDPSVDDSSDIQQASRIVCRVPIQATDASTLFGELVLTPETILLEGQGLWTKDGVNPFAKLDVNKPYPGFVVRMEEPETGNFFCPLPDDLHSTQISLNVDVTDALEVASAQSYGIRTISGGVAKESVAELEASCDTIGLLPEGTTLANSQPTPAVDQYLDVINAFVDMVAIMNNMAPADFKKDAAITALAKQVAENDRANARVDFDGILAISEQELYDSYRMVQSVVTPGLVYPDAKVSVTWSMPTYPADPQNQAVADRMNIDMGMTTPAKILAAREGVELSEAMRQVNENLGIDVQKQEQPSDGNGRQSDDQQKSPSSDSV